MSIAPPAREGASPNAATSDGAPDDGAGPEVPGTSRDATPSRPDASALEDRLPVWFRSTKALPLLALPLGALFLFVASMPLWHTDLWGHLAYGRLIWENLQAGRRPLIPPTEPFMPLAKGVELVDTAWLSQVIGFLTLTRFGIPGLQFLAAACVTAAAGLLAWLGYRKTGSVGWTTLGLAAFLWLEWKQLFNGADTAVLIRPQLAGLVAFAVTLAVAAGRPSRWHWLVVPLTFAAWANLHGSFLAGLALLAAFALGRGGDVLRRTDKFAAVLRDWPFWRLLLLTELAAAAVLINPYGLRLYADAWLFSKNPNLQDLVEWDPLTLRMFQGQAAAGVAFALLFLYRMTPRRIGTGETLALLLFGGLTLWTSRMIVWWAPVAAYCLTLHAAAVWQAHRAKSAAPAEADPEPLTPARRSLWTVTAIGLAWIFFALTPFAQSLLHGPDPKLNRAVSSQTPTGAAMYLLRNPAPGQVFNTYEIGDFLLWSNPGLPVFVSSHAHLVPTDVWQAYAQTVSGSSDWKATLDRYGVNTIVLDKPGRQAFIDRLNEESDWENKYEDRNAAVFRRKEPLK